MMEVLDVVVAEDVEYVVQIVSVRELLVPDELLARAVSIDTEVENVESAVVMRHALRSPVEIEQKIQDFGERVLRFDAAVLDVRVAEEGDVLGALQCVDVEVSVLS